MKHLVVEHTGHAQRGHDRLIEHRVDDDAARALIPAAKGDAGATSPQPLRLPPGDLGADAIGEVALVDLVEHRQQVVDRAAVCTVLQRTARAREQVTVRLDERVDDAAALTVAVRQERRHRVAHRGGRIEEQLVDAHHPHAVALGLRQQHGLVVGELHARARQAATDGVDEQACARGLVRSCGRDGRLGRARERRRLHHGRRRAHDVEQAHLQPCPGALAPRHARTLPQPAPVDTHALSADRSHVDTLVAALFIGFFVLFGVVGAIALAKKRRERIADLTRELEKPLEPGAETEEPAALPAPEGAPVPKAQDLVVAEREAVLARAKEDEARRAVERLSAKQQVPADGAPSSEEPAADELAKARAAEQAAAAEREQATARAKQLRVALSATRDGLVGRLQKALSGKQLDAAVLDDVEHVLFGADIGARTAERLLGAVKTRLDGKDLTDFAKIEAALRAEADAILTSVVVRPIDVTGAPPRVVLVLGVNGSGKTTTIGKLAAQLKGQGKKVLLGAGDTFRAAAADQLEVWAGRADVPIVTGPDGGDPSSVLFDAVKRGVTEGFDVVLCDTAGRLHTKVNLMEELKKVARSIGKACPGAPHEVLLVLDATVGQNAIAQAKQFGEAAPLTGIVLTKLDGTAKGGVVLGIVDELKVPVRLIGVGEQLSDLRPFDPSAFLDALFADERRAA
ncbi:MAG: signal recognition particle-docking protein FtsY [Deltaproteobacteria bacterium]|nr:signal recognition particle-docking protein FtsY [Deltaproteobacteria bacterium]